MKKHRPIVVVIAGPNGAGKSTSAPQLLSGLMGVNEFVNADTIAIGLSAFEPEKVAITAGRIMLVRIKELAKHKTNFAFETTLASRSFVPWLHELISKNEYHLHLVYLWLPTADLAVARVRSRTAMGGHSVPEDTIRRRYQKGLNNFFKLYRPLSHSWRFYNAAGTKIKLIASGSGETSIKIYDSKLWSGIEGEKINASK